MENQCETCDKDKSKMDMNIISKIFPSVDTTNQNILKYDNEGLWSITLPLEADVISSMIKNDIGSDISIFDGTAGLGGNTISFGKIFNNVTSVELNADRFKLLSNNINAYGLTNVQLINGNCLNYLNGNFNVYFFDPPWGGPEYKLNNKTNIKLGNLSLVELISKIKTNKNNNIKIYIKLPNNYDLTEFSFYNYKINKIKNYILVSIG